MGIMLLLIQRTWVMFGNFLCDDLPKGKRPKYRVRTQPPWKVSVLLSHPGPGRSIIHLELKTNLKSSAFCARQRCMSQTCQADDPLEMSILLLSHGVEGN